MKLILTLIFALPVYLSYAQQGTDVPVKQNRISVNLGYNQFKDENLHPKVFHGFTIGSGYSHSRISGHISEYSIGFKASLMNTDYEETISAFNILILGNYRYLFTLVHNEKLEYYLGPVADFQYGSSFYFNWDESHWYFANYLSGGIGNRLSYRMGDKSFDFNLDIPVISCIFRPENNRQYKIDDMTFGGILKNFASNPEAALPDKNFYVKAGIEMKFLSGHEKKRSIGYNFRYHYMQAADGNPYQNIEHAISYKFIF